MGARRYRRLARRGRALSVELALVRRLTRHLLIGDAERPIALRRRRKTQTERAPLTYRRPHGQRPTLQLGESPRNGKPEPRSVLQLRFSELHELMEDSLLIDLGDALA